jgi:hypothetical protein
MDMQNISFFALIVVLLVNGILLLVEEEIGLKIAAGTAIGVGVMHLIHQSVKKCTQGEMIAILSLFTIIVGIVSLVDQSREINQIMGVTACVISVVGGIYGVLKKQK